MKGAVLGSLGVVALVVGGCSIGLAVEASAQAQYYDYSYVDEEVPDQSVAGDGSQADTPTEQATVQTLMPSSCDDIYSPAMRSQLVGAGLALNPSRTAGTEYKGTRDATLGSYIRQPLVCAWVSPQSDTATWVITTISMIDPNEQGAVESRLAGTTQQNFAELGGHRYLTDSTTTGESHLIRSGVWFATAWNTFGPYGYTADMVTHVFG